MPKLAICPSTRGLIHQEAGSIRWNRYHAQWWDIKKKYFFADLVLQNMVETTLPDGLETSGRRAYR